MMEIKPTETNMMMGSNIRALTNIGLWSSIVKSKPILNRIHKVYSICTMSLFLAFFASLYINLFFVYGDFLELIYNLSISVLYIITLAKVILLLFDRKRVSDLVNKTRVFQIYVFNHPNKTSREIFVRYAYVVTLISKGFWILCFFTVHGLVLPAFVSIFGYGTKIDDSGKIIKILPCSCYLPFDEQKYHKTAIITQLFLGYPGTAFVSVWDTFAFALIMNGICQVKVLQNSITNLGNYGKKTVLDTAKECVKFHQNIIQYISELDSLLSTVMFMDFVVYAVLLCSIGARVIFGENVDLSQFISYTTYLGAVLTQLFMFYWTGNQLMLESVEIASAAFKCNWYNFDKRVQRILIVMMIRSKKPLKISIGRFYDMNLESLIIILRAWYSYLTLLKQMFNMRQ